MSIDYIIKNGVVIDGAGLNSLPVKADIAISGAHISETERVSLNSTAKTIDAGGLCICPGFIDVHAHSEFTLLADGRAEGKICQGVTTEINGNCGMSAAPLYGAALEQRESEFAELGISDRWHTFPEYFALLEKRKIATNFITLAGHGNLRASVIGYADSSPSGAQLEEMKALLDSSMNSGARGISTGLIYPPGIYSGTSEIVELAKEAVRYNGIYTTHMRSEGDALLESVDEAISIARSSGIHAHISHLKTSGDKNWGKLKDVFKMIEHAHTEGLAVTCDRYPYIAGSTDLDSILPSWVFEGGRNKEIVRLRSERKRISEDLLREHPEPSCWDTIVVSSLNLERNQWMTGKSLAQIAAVLHRPPIQCLLDILIDEDLRVGAIFFSMNEDNLKEILKKPYTVIGTDSSARSFDGITARGLPHPRGFGSYPRVLKKYVRESGLMTLPEAIYKMTGLPAGIFHIQGRGIVAKGYFADMVVFDPEKINDTAEFNGPFMKPEGIHYVFVNGVPVVYEGQVTGKLPGRILR